MIVTHWSKNWNQSVSRQHRTGHSFLQTCGAHPRLPLHRLLFLVVLLCHECLLRCCLETKNEWAILSLIDCSLGQPICQAIKSIKHSTKQTLSHLINQPINRTIAPSVPSSRTRILTRESPGAFLPHELTGLPLNILHQFCIFFFLGRIRGCDFEPLFPFVIQHFEKIIDFRCFGNTSAPRNDELFPNQ